MKGVVNSASFFYIARNPDHECPWGHTLTRGDIFRESGSVILLWILIVKIHFRYIQIEIMNSRSQRNIARNTTKVKLQPRHLELISTWNILQGIVLRTYFDRTGRHVVGRKIPHITLATLATSFLTRDTRATFGNILFKVWDFICRKVLALGDVSLDAKTDVLKVGLEPTQSCPHMPLKHACLPVPPLQQ